MSTNTYVVSIKQNQPLFALTSVVVVAAVLVAGLFFFDRTAAAQTPLFCTDNAFVPFSTSFGKSDPFTVTQGEVLSMPITITNTSAEIGTFAGVVVGVIVAEASIERGFPIAPFALTVAGSLPALSPGEEASVSMEWQVPPQLPSGEYQVVFFHEIGAPEAALGRVATDLVGIGSFSFTVASAPTKVSGLSELAVSGAVTAPSGQVVIEDPITPITFSTVVTNHETDTALRGSLTWELYEGNAPHQSKLLRAQTDEIKQVPRAERTVTFTVPYFDVPVATLLLRATLDSGEQMIVTQHIVQNEQLLNYQQPAVQFMGFSSTGVVACFNLGDQLSYGAATSTESGLTLRLARDGATVDTMVAEPIPATTQRVFKGISLPWDKVSGGTFVAALSRGEVVLDRVSLEVECAEFPCANPAADATTPPLDSNKNTLTFYWLFTIAALLLATIVIRRLPTTAESNNN